MNKQLCTLKEPGAILVSPILERIDESPFRHVQYCSTNLDLNVGYEYPRCRPSIDAIVLRVPSGCRPKGGTRNGDKDRSNAVHCIVFVTQRRYHDHLMRNSSETTARTD